MTRAPADTVTWLRRARDHADQHYAEPRVLDDLAAIAGLSKYHFHRLFAATFFHPKRPVLHVHLSTPSKPLSDDLIAAMRRAQDEGGLPGVGMHVDDCRGTYEELKAKGVEFLQEPQGRPYGVEALMRDDSGNWMVLVEPHDHTPEDFEGVDFSIQDAGPLRGGGT